MEELWVLLLPIVGIVIVFGVMGFIVVPRMLRAQVGAGPEAAARARVLKNGTAAQATVLSAESWRGGLSLIYEVRPASGAPFRCRGYSPFYDGPPGDPKVGDIVNVRIDPADGSVVYVDKVNPRDEIAEAEAAVLAREEQLLRGHQRR